MNTNSISNKDITRLIQDYVKDYQQRPGISTKWGIPQVGSTENA